MALCCFNVKDHLDLHLLCPPAQSKSMSLNILMVLTKDEKKHPLQTAQYISGDGIYPLFSFGSHLSKGQLAEGSLFLWPYCSPHLVVFPADINEASLTVYELFLS